MNSRKIFLSAIGIASGIAIASLNQTLKIIFIACLILSLAIFLLFAKSKWGLAILLSVCVALGFVCFSVNINLYHNADANQQQVTVIGTVTDEEYLLKNCTVDGKKVGDGNAEHGEYVDCNLPILHHRSEHLYEDDHESEGRRALGYYRQVGRHHRGCSLI